MTEEEIKKYLRNNKQIGVVFGKMPESVRAWLKEQQNAQNFLTDILVYRYSDWTVWNEDPFSDDEAVAMEETDNISKAVLQKACDEMIDWASEQRTEENLPDIDIEYYSGYINAIEDVLYALEHNGKWRDEEFIERCKKENAKSETNNQQRNHG